MAKHSGDMISRRVILAIVLVGLLVMSYVMVHYGLSFGLALAFLPLFLMLLLAIIKKPFLGFLLLFILNYFIITIMRYTRLDGLSVGIDVVILLTFLSLLLNWAKDPVKSSRVTIRGLTAVALLWAIFCCLELLNPTSMLNAWFLSRGLTAYFLLMVWLTMMCVKSMKEVWLLLYVLSVLTLIGVSKALMQKWFGFDASEQHFLSQGSYRTHLLFSGTRYFSIYASAGIFGAIMGHALVLFGIAAFYVSGVGKKVYFLFVAVAALYGLMISGTRGALAIPAAGIVLFVILSKQIKIIIPMLVLLTVTYIFFAMTTIGQSNAQIRRMRTAFNLNEPSLVVRKENQKLLRAYLKDKPFGEGLGLSGVEAKDISERYTTSIPTDSWYVKIWVETGIVGLLLYCGILIYVLLHGSFLVLFRVKNRSIKGVMTALLCGLFGIMIASYGNQVLGQYPVVMIVYMSMALVFMSPYFDRQQAQESVVQNLVNE